jgi:alkylation response protein AidB-like acyl-CoA dehydrogenase
LKVSRRTVRAVFDFALTPDQRTLRDGIREFGRIHVIPNSATCENERRLMPEIAAAFHGAGFAKPWFRSDGDACGLMTAGALIAEELGYADPAYASYLMLPVLFNHIVIGYLRGATKEALLHELEREHVVTWATR